MKKVLITGGAGFIGSQLAQQYLIQGDQVFILDNLTTGSIENIKHLEDFSKTGKLFVTIDSILNRAVLENLVSSVDIVVHLAAAVGVKYILDNPLDSFRINLTGTEMVLELCDQFKKTVLIASTSEVYGKQSHAPLEENDDCVYGPSSKFRWSYAGGKLMDEFYALAYFRAKSLPVIIVRLFNTVGPRQSANYGMVMPRLVRQALRNQEMTVFGDGKQTRTFTHVKESVACIMALIERNSALGEVVNIGGVEEVSIYDLALKIKSKTNSSSEITLVPYDQAYPKDFEDMLRRVPCTNKLKSIIGFVPSLSLDAILDDVIAFEKKSLAAEAQWTKVVNI